MKPFVHTLAVLLCLLFSCSKDELEENKKPEDKPEPQKEILKQSLTGFVEKGPFISGSSLTVNELSYRLNQTGSTFTTKLKNNEGEFYLKELALFSPYIQISVDGFFLNEISGKLSTAKITLYALSYT